YPRYRLRNTRTCTLYFLRSSRRKNPLTPSNSSSPSMTNFCSSGVRSCDGTFELRETGAIVRLGPRFDRAAVDRLVAVGHDQIQIELDDVAEPVTRRARAERIVEREQTRLRHLVR